MTDEELSSGIERIASIGRGELSWEALTYSEWIRLLAVIIWLLNRGYEILRDLNDESGEGPAPEEPSAE